MLASLVLIFSLFVSYHRYYGETTVKFSAQEDCASYIIKEIEKANHSIEFAYYVFTDKEVAEALLRAKNRGLLVRGILEAKCANNLSKKLVKQKLAKFVKRKSGIMHHKFIILDKKIVIAGSYNLTYSAKTKNDENLISIKDEFVISRFYQEFLRILY